MSRANHAAQIASEEMKSGKNCCQSVLIAAARVWDLPLTPEMIGAGAMFGKGMGAGCTCGALAGMIMASGLRNHFESTSTDMDFAKVLHDHFKQEFGFTCCRAIRKGQNLWDRMGQKACQDLTSRAAAMLIRDWEAYTSAADFGSYSHP